MIRAPAARNREGLYRAISLGHGGADWIDLAHVDGNHQRLCRHHFDPVEAIALRVIVLATNGDPLARIFEIRCYG